MRPVEFTLGGLKRKLRVELGLAPEIEAATGKSLLTLFEQCTHKSITTGDMCSIIRVALEGNGQVYTDDAVFKMMIEHEGFIAGGLLPAHLIILSFFAEPKKDDKPRGKAPPASGGRLARANASR